MIAGRVIWTREQGMAARRIGKIVPYQGGLVYVFDQPTVYRRLQAYGVAETVLVEMLRDDAPLVHYVVGSDTYMAERDAVIADGIVDRMPAGRAGYLYVPLKAWTIHRGRLGYPWIPETQRVELPWRVDAPELDEWRKGLLAARPVKEPAPVQGSLWA